MAVKTIPAASLLSVLLLGAQLGAAEAPCGHPDYYPSPERPIGFRGDGNGCFPGATPVTEWWEGTPKKVTVPLQQQAGAPKDAEVWDYADGNPKNIVWKTPLPGWSMAPPIVVGDRVFAVGEPHWLVCLDAHTGKVLWQREVLALELGGMPQEKARRLHDALEVARITHVLRGQHGPGSLVGAGEEAQRLRRALPGLMKTVWRPVIEAADPELLGPFADDLRLAEELAALAPDDLEGFSRKRFNSLQRAMEKKYGVHVERAWIGYFGYALGSPVSDGRRVYVQFYSGAVACFDLDGNLRWGRHFVGGGNHYSCFEPLSLHGDVLVVRDCQRHAAVGLAAATGEQRWRVPFQETNVGGCGVSSQYCHDLTVRLPLPGGAQAEPGSASAKPGAALPAPGAAQAKPGAALLEPGAALAKPGGIVEALILQSSRRIIRPSDGKVLGQFRYEIESRGERVGYDGRGQVLSGHGDVFHTCTNSDTGGGPFRAYRLKALSADAVEAELLYEIATAKKEESPKTMGHRAAGPAHLFTENGIFDSLTGRKVAGWPVDRRVRAMQAPVVAGQYVIGSAWQSPGNDPNGRKRKDRKAVTEFTVVDVSDPPSPRLLAGHNLLGDASPPADGAVAKYLPGLDPLLFTGVYKGTPSWFGCALGGVVPNANRIFVQSASHLYCIGDPAVPYNWNPASRPPRAAAAAKEER